MSEPDGYDALVSALVARGVIAREWQDAFRRVPRARFIPDRVWSEPVAAGPVDRADDPARWARLVASDVPLATKLDAAGVPTSSSSMPYMVATMLGHLDVPDGGRVLEIGAGTGWNAALLCARLGSDRVTSVEVDPQVAEAAAARLSAAGFAPRLVVGDGAAGDPAGGPYDAIIATCALRRVPPAWLAQVRPGGTIVAPFGTAFRNGCLLRLTARADGTAAGRFVDDAAFMWMGPWRGPGDLMRHVRRRDRAVAGATDLDPRQVLGDDAAHAVGLLAPGIWRSVGRGQGEAARELTLWLVDPDSDSWAAIDYEPGRSAFETLAYGPRATHEEVRAAHAWWREAGAPQRFRFGLTAGPSGHHCWLDHPDQPTPVFGTASDWT